MKRIQYHNYGGPELMRLEEFDLARPGKGQVAVKVKFAAINPIDWKLRKGQMKIVTGNRFPRAMGMDFSGIVLSVGPGVVRFKAGEAVFGLAPFKETGALGQAVLTNETSLAKKPDCIAFEEAACLGTPGVTAWNGLVDKAKLAPGMRVLVNGCAGAVGEATVQIARMRGATVSGSCSAEDMERARSLGVQSVFDYRTSALSETDERYDVVYDTAATMTTSMGMGLLGEGGVFLDLNPSPAKFIRSIFNRRLKPIVCTPRPDILENVALAASERKFHLPIGKIVALGEAIELLTALEAGRKFGGKGLVKME